MKKVLACLALSGCATTAQIQEKDPAVEFPTTKSVAALEECLALKLGIFGAPSVVRGEERTIMTWGQPMPALTVTIGAAVPRTVAVRAAVVAGKGVKQRVRECAE